MTEDNNLPKTLEQVIKSRRSIRDFTTEVPRIEDVEEILKAALYAPYGGATGFQLNEIRKIFVFTQNSDKMKEARELLLSQIKKNSQKINNLLVFFPFLKKKMRPFANRLKSISNNGIPSLNEAPYYIVVAEKKGFPPIGKQSIAHALQNMWLTATEKGLGFQLVSATGTMTNNKQFLQLLGLTWGEYEIDGCVIGYATKYPETIKDIDFENCVKWIK
jgi:nitroreductase